MQHYEALSQTIDALIGDGKGILAADESTQTIGKRFQKLNVENTEANRRNWRLLLAETEGLEEYISGVILYEETFDQMDKNGATIPDVLEKKGIVPGIKVDKGLIDLIGFPGEKATKGLDDLYERLVAFKAKGARFAKWRNVYSISDWLPSRATIQTGASVLAQYAAMCQEVGLVPIVEPEVLMDGTHEIEQCAEVQARVLRTLFETLFLHRVDFNTMLLKPSMVTSGKETKPFSPPEEVADFTLAVFRECIPAAVPGIVFLSGGQSSLEATANLNAINAYGMQPWVLSFSYGRALQEEALSTWKGKAENVQKAQACLLHRAKMNSLATLGEYESQLES